jgi:hypothetical protein
MTSMAHQTTNLGGRSSNLFGRAINYCSDRDFRGVALSKFGLQNQSGALSVADTQEAAPATPPVAVFISS